MCVGVPQFESDSEGNVVDVHEWLVAGGRTARRRLRAGSRRTGLHGYIGHPSAAEALTRLAALQGLDAVRANLDARALLAVLALPFAGAQPAFGVDLVPLAQLLGSALGGLVPDLDVEPLRLLLPLAVGALEVVVHRDAQVGHGLSARRVAQLRIGAEVADDHHLVQGHRGVSSPFSAKAVAARAAGSSGSSASISA